MFCDIEVVHRRSITGNGLRPALGNFVQNEIVPPENAYAETQLLQLHRPPGQLFAFHAYGCVIIALGTDYKSSRYHLEGPGQAFTVERLFQSAGKFSKDLVAAVKKNATYRVSEINFQMLQSDGGETRIEGRLLTFWPGFKDAFDFKAVLSSVSTFATALILLRFGVKEETLKSVGISFGAAVIFTFLEAMASYLWNGGKMKWSVMVR
jgi:hypothetical protein